MENKIDRRHAIVTLKDGYNGATEECVVNCTSRRDVTKAEELAVYAHHSHGTFRLGSLLERHLESSSGLAHFLREHSQVLGFRMLGSKI